MSAAINTNFIIKSLLTVNKSTNIDLTMKKKLFLAKNGYIEAKELCQTLQGSIWLAKNRSTHQGVAIKIAIRDLVNTSTARHKGKEFEVDEDIKSEALLLKFVSADPKCPSSITKFVRFFKSHSSYYLVMENGGDSLFKFIKSAHRLIEAGRLRIPEWHRLVKIIFKQMIECIEYLHLLNICHMDISLENFLISEIETLTYRDRNGNWKMVFTQLEKVQVKLCDFGLAAIFPMSQQNKSKSSKFVGKKNYMSPEIINKKNGFDAQKNDIWCVGICLFMMIMGGGPVNIASMRDELFVRIMNNEYIYLMKSWERMNYVNDEILDIFRMIFKREDARANIDEIKASLWLKDNENNN